MDYETRSLLHPEINAQPDVIKGQKADRGRFSSKDQKPLPAKGGIKVGKFYCVFTDTDIGSFSDRPRLDRAFNYPRASDELVMTSTSRLTCSLIELLAWATNLPVGVCR